MKIGFLIHDKTPPTQAENARLLSQAARELGHEVALLAIDTLAAHDGKVTASASALETFGLIWVLSLGSRENFLDKIQLLKLLVQKTRVVNSPDALLYLHSKISLSALGEVMPYPETHVSADAETLWRIAKERGGKWVIKPPAESFGEGVQLLQSKEQLQDGNYFLLQRYVPEIEQGEKRVLLAGGEVVGCYLRKAGRDFRTNLHQGGEPSPCGLTDKEKAACETVGKYLIEKGAFFAGIDLAWPYIIEWNVVCPGGIATVLRVSGENIAKTVVGRVLASSQTP